MYILQTHISEFKRFNVYQVNININIIIQTHSYLCEVNSVCLSSILCNGDPQVLTSLRLGGIQYVERDSFEQESVVESLVSR